MLQVGPCLSYCLVAPPTREDMAFTALHWWALQGALQAEEHQKPVAQVQVQECSVRR